VPGKSVELPLGVAGALVEDTHAYFAEPSAIKRDEIARNVDIGVSAFPPLLSGQATTSESV
jgi:hypothetical protein